MNKKSDIQNELAKEYQLRFGKMEAYRNEVWEILTSDFFQKYIGHDNTVLDLGCGWGEFINNIKCGAKYGMDLNHDVEKYLNQDVTFINQDCSKVWDIKDSSLDVIFTSNFFEHLPSKSSLSKTLEQANRTLKPNGKIICMGPNIKYTKQAYWDFFDHHIALTELSLKEILEMKKFNVVKCLDRFLPYTMVNKNPTPMCFIKIYLKLNLVWKLMGQQFLIIATKVD